MLHVQISHSTHVCLSSPSFISFLAKMSHVTHMAHMNESCHVTYVIYEKGVHDMTHSYVMSHIWHIGMSHVM